MTNDEIQRTMEFILQQQASFFEGMERLRESHEQAEKRISNLETAYVNIANVVTELGKAQQVLTERVNQLTEAQAHTDQRLNALIDIIERRRNGESKG